MYVCVTVIMLNSKDLERGAVILPKSLNYLGDFPIDRLPSPQHQEQWWQRSGTLVYSFIANTAPASHTGEHWFAVVHPPLPATRLLLIDPYALPLNLLLKPLKVWLQKQQQEEHRVTSLKYPLQPMESTGCGAFCLFILEKLPLYNFNLDEITRWEFDQTNLWSNHHRVMQWWRRRVEGKEV